MLTKIKLILLKEEVTATKIFDEANRIFYPSLHMCQLSRIISGKQIAAYLLTYLKILKALNNLTGKEYKLEDIIEENIINNDLK